MTDSEKLDLILSEIQVIKGDIQSMKDDILGVKGDIKGLDKRMTSLELHIENGTDRNIQLVAENFVELTKKLNQAIPVADKNLAYEVKVNYLIEEVNTLKKEVSEIKSKIA